MIKEHPILFQTEMIKAILEGRKTMTRRVVSPRNSTCGSLLTGDGQGWHSFDFNDVVVDGIKSDYWYLKVAVPEDFTRHRIFNRVEIGDQFWVREAWAEVGMTEIFSGKKNKQIVYRAGRKVLTDDNIRAANYDMSKAKATIGDGFDINPSGKWKPSIHMKKDYARIWLKVTGIKVERLQDISEEDAKAEGIMFDEMGYKDYDKKKAVDYGHPDHDWPHLISAVDSYCSLWKEINGEESWNENPWVWCISFKRVNHDRQQS